MERRAINFSNYEISVLLSMVEEYKDIIECKKTDAVMWKDKEKVWEKISERLLELGFSKRSTKQLKDKWCNLKKETKRKYGEERIERFKTGGGSGKIINITENDEKIKAIVGVAITGENNIFDSDNQIETKDPPDCVICGKNNWASWNPLSLKAPKASALRTLEEQAFNRSQEKFIIIPKSKLSSYQEKKSVDIENRNQHVVPPEQHNPTYQETESLLNIEDQNSTKNGIQHEIPPAQSPTYQETKNLSSKENKNQHTPTTTAIKKKAILTADCRLKINTLSEAKLELVKIQKECLLKEMLIKNEEHKLHMEQTKEEHAIKMKKHMIELEHLELQKKNLSSSHFESF